MGVILESEREWRSPVVLVPKPDDSVRFCINFRKVNAISKFYAYPMPGIDQLLEWLGPAKHVLFKDILFDLHGAAMTFQQLVNRILSLPHEYSVAYIDNTVNHSPPSEDYL